jgi:hypothetical protein
MMVNVCVIISDTQIVCNTLDPDMYAALSALGAEITIC